MADVKQLNLTMLLEQRQMAKQSTDYHDYVFRDGKLVGEFEEMYQRSATIPWHQDEQADWIDVRLTKELLSDIGLFDEIHDLGCGLGNYLGLMRERVGATVCQGFGYDISATACTKAKQQFPAFQFAQLDLTLALKPATRNPQPATRNPQPATRNPQPADCSSFAARFGTYSRSLIP